MNISELGKKCREWRKDNYIPQRIIANDLGVSIELISAFEHGRTNNATILMWYIEHGFALDD